MSVEKNLLPFMTSLEFMNVLVVKAEHMYTIKQKLSGNLRNIFILLISTQNEMKILCKWKIISSSAKQFIY